MKETARSNLVTFGIASVCGWLVFLALAMQVAAALAVPLLLAYALATVLASFACSLVHPRLPLAPLLRAGLAVAIYVTAVATTLGPSILTAASSGPVTWEPMPFVILMSGFAGLVGLVGSIQWSQTRPRRLPEEGRPESVSLRGAPPPWRARPSLRRTRSRGLPKG